MRWQILNVGKLRKGGELYYLNSVARGVEDYYTGSGEAPGYWLAGGAADLKLEGEVGRDELRAVLNGDDPSTGRSLIEGKRPKRERVPGFDLTFRAPKSVSLIHALGGKEASNQVVSAHDAAVTAALDYLERHASAARRGRGGKNRISSSGFIGAAFRHRTSRAGDPLLHTHVLVANMVKGEDGRWGALDGRQLYIHAKTAGYLYQAQLRHELTRRLGIEWSPVRKGCADIAGIPRAVIRAFSKRRSEIEEIVGEVSEANAKAAQVAAITSRKAKDYRITPNDLLPEWRDRAERLGLGEAALASLLDRTTHQSVTPQELASMAKQLAGPEGLTKQQSSFTRREAIQGFCGQLGSGAAVRDIERMADDFLASELVVALAARSEGLTAKDSLRVSDGRVIPAGVEERRYSTGEMLSVEHEVVDRAIERRLSGCAIAETAVVEAALASRPRLFADQQAMVKRLTTSGQGVEVVVGKAGAGKTFALDAARDAWESSGYRVIGCAQAARAAEELQFGSGIPSYTIRGLLQDLDHPELGGLARDSVVVVDEAGMVGTRDLERLLAHAERANAKVVLVGDDRQLPAIDSGGAFRGIKNRLPAIELSEVRRQPFGWERDALDLIREGQAQKAIDAYMAHDRVVIAKNADETRKRLLGDWWATRDDAEPAVMLAAHRSDVADLNAQARAMMKVAGRLGSDEVRSDDLSFTVGDRVMTLKNTRRLGVKNGNRGTVQRVDVARREVTFRRDDGRVFTLPRSYIDAGHLTHSYAITGHKSQGMTTDKAFVLADQTLYREWAYVAMSRGRNDNRLYVVAGIDTDREEVGGEVAPVEDPLREVVAAVGRSRAKDLALDSYEHEEIRNMTTTQLRHAWESARGIVAEMPPDPAGEAAQLKAERLSLERALARQESLVGKLERELDSFGVVAKRRKRAQVMDLRSRTNDASEGRDAIVCKLDDLGGREVANARAKGVREAWLLENAPSVRRLDMLGRELWWREHQQALAAEVAMPQYLREAVGECPMKPSDRAAWHEAVRAIETYRDRWQVDDETRALGDLPQDPQQVDDHEAAQHQIDSAVASAREVDVRERAIEL